MALSVIQILFLAEYLKNGGNGSKAALAVKPEYGISTAQQMAVRWLAMPEAKEWLEAAVVQAGAAARRSLVLTASERREWLARVVRADVRQLARSSTEVDGDLLQSAKCTVDMSGNETLEIKLPSKLDALKLDAQLAGELKPEVQLVGVAPDLDAILDRLTGQQVVEAEVLPPIEQEQASALSCGTEDEFMADLLA